MKNINNDSFIIGDKVLTPYGSGIIRDINGLICTVEHSMPVSSTNGSRAPLDRDNYFGSYDIDQLQPVTSWTDSLGNQVYDDNL